MRHGVEKVVGHGQPHDVERPVAADQHHAAQQRGTYIVGMGRAAQQRLAHHGELHQLLARERAAQQFVDPVDGGGRRGCARPDAAAGSDLFENLHLDPHRTAVSFEQGPYGGRDDVFFDISGEFHPAAVTDFESFGIFRNAHFQHVAHAVERKAHHIETAPQIRDRSRRENLNMFHTIFF